MKLLLIALIITVIASCSSKPDKPIYHASDLVGVWELRFDGRYPYWFSHVAFTEQGRKCVLSYEFDKVGKVGMTYYGNHYKVEDAHLFTFVGYSSTPYVNTGDIIKDRIDVLTPDYLEVFMVQPFIGDTVEQHQRLDGVSPQQICKIVDDHQRAQSAQ